jgi:hypothetical protein
VHLLLKWPGTRRLREHLLSRKWLTANEEIACKKIINCTSTLELRKAGSNLYKVKPGSLVSIVSGRPGDQGSIPVRGKRFFL